MSFNVRDSFILKSSKEHIVNRTNTLNTQLKQIIEDELVISNLKTIFKYFVIFSHNIYKSASISDFIDDITKNDFLINHLVKNSKFSDKNFSDSFLKFISSITSLNLKSEFLKDIFIFHKILDSKTYYVIDSSDNELQNIILNKINNDDSLNLIPFDCDAKNSRVNQNEWEKVLEGESIYTGLYRIQVDFGDYYYKIAEYLHNSIEDLFPNENEIKNIIYFESIYLDKINDGKSKIQAYLETKTLMQDHKYDNNDLNNTLISRETLISKFRAGI